MVLKKPNNDSFIRLGIKIALRGDKLVCSECGMNTEKWRVLQGGPLPGRPGRLPGLRAKEGGINTTFFRIRDFDPEFKDIHMPSIARILKSVPVCQFNKVLGKDKNLLDTGLMELYNKNEQFIGRHGRLAVDVECHVCENQGEIIFLERIKV